MTTYLTSSDTVLHTLNAIPVAVVQRDADFKRIKPLIEAASWYVHQRGSGGGIAYVPLDRHKALLQALATLGIVEKA